MISTSGQNRENMHTSNPSTFISDVWLFIFSSSAVIRRLNCWSDIMTDQISLVSILISSTAKARNGLENSLLSLALNSHESMPKQVLLLVYKFHSKVRSQSTYTNRYISKRNYHVPTSTEVHHVRNSITYF